MSYMIMFYFHPSAVAEKKKGKKMTMVQIRAEIMTCLFLCVECAFITITDCCCCYDDAVILTKETTNQSNHAIVFTRDLRTAHCYRCHDNLIF